MNDEFDNEYILLEVERIKILFEENEYTTEDKKNFIELKSEIAKKNNDRTNLRICNILTKEISEQ